MNHRRSCRIHLFRPECHRLGLSHPEVFIQRVRRFSVRYHLEIVEYYEDGFEFSQTEP